ncbi:MAG: hypothetical protein QM683_06000 [Lacrimispora sp.]
MQTTSNLGLKKPDQNEYVNVEDLNYNADEIDKLGAPEFDDSGAVSGITSFPAYLTTLMSGTNFFTFFRNLKAGLKFVLHTGQLVNNGQTTEPGFALDARYGKTLADAITQLNANFSYYSHIRYGIKFFADSGGKDWVRIPLADLGFPNDTLTNYPCVIALPQINIADTQNTNRDIQILCSKPNGDRKSIELLLNRSFTGGALFSVWYTA